MIRTTRELMPVLVAVNGSAGWYLGFPFEPWVRGAPYPGTHWLHKNAENFQMALNHSPSPALINVIDHLPGYWYIYDR